MTLIPYGRNTFQKKRLKSLSERLTPPKSHGESIHTKIASHHHHHHHCNLFNFKKNFHLFIKYFIMTRAGGKLRGNWKKESLKEDQLEMEWMDVKAILREAEESSKEGGEVWGPLGAHFKRDPFITSFCIRKVRGIRNMNAGRSVDRKAGQMRNLESDSDQNSNRR